MNNSDIVSIADAAERALGMETVIRYLDMFHWQVESAAYHAGQKSEKDICPIGPRLESVAAHTWHMTYVISLLLPYFSQLDARRVYEIAVVHDILELITGDYDPTGTDGLGTDGHSMNAGKLADKTAAELAALEHYISALPAAVQSSHRALLTEEMAGLSDEARFVKVIDKMQSLLYINAKKDGTISDDALQFLYRYKGKTAPKFPPLTPLYEELYDRLVQRAAAYRKVPAATIWQMIEEQAKAA